jgi:phenylalanyl-tRNA synthetase beta chain
MQLSLEWLNDHVDLGDLTPQRIGELFTLHVADVGEMADPWPGVTVGDVLAVRPHPNAEKLTLVSVDAGDGEREVVCGAPNVAAGLKICFAPSGTTLPGGLKLEKSDEHEGILVLDTKAAAGTPARDVLPGGRVLDVENTDITTRPDLWGHHGAARELAAVLERELRPLDLGEAFPKDAPQVKVTVECPDLCPRYLGWVIGGIEIAPSPAWLQRRLIDAGQRPINNVVDLTNYILLECGQPLHAFDRRQIADAHIIVRRAHAGERVTTLDEVERTLPKESCVIADPERAVAVAGVMGLANSEVMDDTTEIVLEVANFEFRSIRATARALDLRTESAIRFEKGLDADGVAVAARRFFRILKEICPTASPLGGPCDVRVEPEPPRRITLDAGFIPARLGTELAAERVDGILGRLGFDVKRAKGKLTVTVPSWRAGNDIALAEDLVEEVGRVHGYDKIEPIPLYGALEPIEDEPERAARRRARDVCSFRSGLAEIHTYPFITADDCRRAGLEPGTLQLSNAEQPGLDLMRTSAVPRMLRALAENLKYRAEVGLYAIEPVFLKEGADELPRENERVTIGIARRDAEAGNPTFLLKGAVEALLSAFRLRGARLQQEEGPAWLHPGRAAKIARGRQVFGWLGEVHPRVARAFEIESPAAVADLDFDAVRAAAGREARLQPIGRFPTVPYDVAVVVDRRTPAADVEGVLRKVDDRLVRDVRLFDVYEGDRLEKGKRSLAFTIVFGSLERTLGTEDVEKLRARVEQAIGKRGWTLRI